MSELLPCDDVCIGANPGAVEIQDRWTTIVTAIDDTIADEYFTTYYRDLDGDGWSR